jgi:5-formyltetrahydrofolate cyclo-ligase
VQHSDPDVVAAKRALRDELLTRRRARTDAQRAAADEALLVRLVGALAADLGGVPAADLGGATPDADASPLVAADVPAHDDASPLVAADVPAHDDASPLVAADVPAHDDASPLVAAYVPVGTEPGGRGLPDALRAAGYAVLLPVLEPDGDLDWALHTGALVPGPHGLLQPAGPRRGRDAIRAAAAVVVPAVAVDRRGVRLGRGGGSYDRALARILPSTPVLALLYDGEFRDALPAEPHDRRVGTVVSPGGVHQV